MKLFAPTIAALLLASPALAANGDTRVRSILFVPDKIVKFVGKPGYQSSIRLGEDERIENVAIGDSVSWQVTPNKRGDRLFLKPMVPNARSNLMVVTDRRTYLFDLEASRAGQPIYALSFRYPVFPAPGSVEPPPAPIAAPARLAADDVRPPPPLKLNFAWVSRGAKSLRPSRTFDDSKAVYIAWPENVSLPAVLVPAPGGIESPVNYRVENGYIVVDGLPPQIILRRGKEEATVIAGRRRDDAVQTAQSEKQQ